MGLSHLLACPSIVHWHEDIAELIDYSNDRSLPSRLSEVFNKVIRHEAFILKLYKAGNSRPVILSHDIPAHLHELYFHRYLSSAYLHDPLMERMRGNETLQIIQINAETCSLQGSEYYKTYYKNLSLQDEVDFLLPMKNSDLLVLSFGRKMAITTREEIIALTNTSALVKSLLSKYYRYLTKLDDAESQDARSAHGKIEKRLTTREKEIVQFMVSGKSTKVIARYLDISIQTVKVHRRNIYSKLGINTELQLCSLFLSTKNLPC